MSQGRPALRSLLAGLLGAAALAAALPAGAAEVEGVRFRDRVEWGGEDLRLNGVGLLRYRVFLKGYVAALYLGDRIVPERALADVPRRLEIEYFWSIPADAFARATVEGISRNVDADAFEGLREHIDALSGLYADVAPGDRYSLTYVPGLGTELALNGEPLGRIEGAEFSAALFAIWIGDRALDDSLRERLLARR